MSKKLLFNFNREVIQNYTYVKYVGTIITATNTLEKPIKSAILKGHTSVNLFKNKVTHRDTAKFIYVEEGDKIQATFKDGVTNGWMGFSFKENVPFEIGKTYTVMNELYKCDDQLGSFNISLGNKRFNNGEPVIGINKLKIIIPSDYTEGTNWMYYDVSNTNNSATIFSSNLLILEGDYTQEDIPYFEGMQSVKMPVLTTSNYKNLANDIFIDYGYISDGIINIQKKWLISDFISIEPNVSYTTRSQGATNDGVFAIAFYDKVKTFINKKVTNNAISPTNAKFARINVRKRNGLDVTEEEKNDTILYLEKTTEVLPFESHKTNILTVNEDLELRGIGDIKDELDCLTGEVIERIGEVVLDGSEDEKLSLRLSHGLVYQGVLYNNNYISNHQLKKIYSNKIERFCIIIPSTITSISEARQWLSENNVIIQLPLAEESIKTVDLSILDQNGNKVSSISSFNDTTHITASSETIPPIFEGYLATKEVE